jgi:prepilin-type N-terminal cleavage/methylation domain-containing protein
MNLSYFWSKRRGFTLLELLVVISIIGLLSSIVLATLSSARSRARNAQTIQTIRQYILAIELYRNDKNSVPVLADPNLDYCLGPQLAGTCTVSATLNNMLDDYISISAGPSTITNSQNYPAQYNCPDKGSFPACNHWGIEWYMEAQGGATCGGRATGFVHPLFPDRLVCTYIID